MKLFKKAEKVNQPKGVTRVLPIGKRQRYEFECKMRNEHELLGGTMGFVNNVIDTCENFISRYGDNTQEMEDNAVNQNYEKVKGQLRKGDHIRVKLCLPYLSKLINVKCYHHGIYDGNGMVYEYKGSSTGPNYIRKCDLKSFARGKEIMVDNREEAIYSEDEIVRRAESRLGEQDYNILYNNCENYATWCRCGCAL